MGHSVADRFKPARCGSVDIRVRDKGVSRMSHRFLPRFPEWKLASFTNTGHTALVDRGGGVWGWKEFKAVLCCV